MPELFHSADLVVSMGGYNTVCELACAGARALIAPRTTPRREQWIRAEILKRRGVLSCVDEDELSPEALMAEVRTELQRDRPAAGWGLRLDGLEGAADLLAEYASAEQRVLGATVAWGRC
jgi:predicted glycosyltransferase